MIKQQILICTFILITSTIILPMNIYDLLESKDQVIPEDIKTVDLCEKIIPKTTKKGIVQYKKVYIIEYTKDKGYEFKGNLADTLRTINCWEAYHEAEDYCNKYRNDHYDKKNFEFHSRKCELLHDRAITESRDRSYCIGKNKRSSDLRKELQYHISRNNATYCDTIPYDLDYNGDPKYKGAILLNTGDKAMCNLYRKYRMEKLREQETPEEHMRRLFVQDNY